MENQTTEIISLKNLETLPKQQIEEMLQLYSASKNMETYAKIAFGVIAVLFLIQNVFIAGKSYPIDTYDTIMAVELSIVGIIVLAVFVIAGIAIAKSSKLKDQIVENSKKYQIKKQDLAEEFSLIAMRMYGGNGIKVK